MQIVGKQFPLSVGRVILIRWNILQLSQKCRANCVEWMKSYNQILSETYASDSRCLEIFVYF